MRRMLRKLSASELAEWEQFHALQPFGLERDDFRAGMIAAPLLNAWRAKGSRSRKPEEWIYVPRPLRPKQSGEHMRMILEGLAKAYEEKEKRQKNGDVTRRPKRDAWG